MMFFFLILYTEMSLLKCNVECGVQKSVAFPCIKDQSSLLKLRFLFLHFLMENGGQEFKLNIPGVL